MPSKKPALTPRKPPKPELAALDRFVESGSKDLSGLGSEILSHPDPKTNSSYVTRKRTGRTLKRFSVYVDPQLVARFKAWCAMNGVDMSDTVNDMIDEFLKEKGFSPS